jgi:hypothetical protein
MRSGSNALLAPDGFKRVKSLPPIDFAPYGIAVKKGNTALADL